VLQNSRPNLSARSLLKTFIAQSSRRIVGLTYLATCYTRGEATAKADHTIINNLYLPVSIRTGINEIFTNFTK